MSSENPPHPVSIASCVQITTVMSQDLVTVPLGVSVSAVAAKMAERQVGSCLVMDEGILRGVITEQDLTRKVVAAGVNPHGIPVSAIMSSPVVTIGADRTVGEAADLMIRHNIRRIVVEEDDHTVGIVTSRDVLGFASDMNTILQDLSGMYGTLMFLDRDMQVLWINRPPDGGDAPDGSGPVYCYEILHGNHVPCHGCPLTLSGTDSGGAVQTSEIIDKERRIWQVQCHPVRWGEGKILGVIESAIEITRERKLEQALQEHRNQLDIVVDGADLETWYCRGGPDGVEIGSSGGVVFAPESRFFGTGEMSGYLQRKVYPDDMPPLIAMIDGLIAGRELFGEIRFRMLIPGGGWRWVRAVGRVIDTAPNGAAMAIAGVNVDITDLINYRDAIRRANKKLNLLASVTRHDVLNQVSAILLAGELLEIDGYLDGDGELAENIGRILSSAAIIERHIAFTQEYRGLGEADPEWQDVSRLAGTAARESGQNDVAVVCECEGLDVYADPMFGNVIFNLIDNAARHGTGTKNITIRFSDTKEGGILIVEDDGEGVPADLKEDIFRCGYGKHTGFGLFLSREILDITGISIHECGVPGEGARFEMLIPHSEYRFA